MCWESSHAPVRKIAEKDDLIQDFVSIITSFYARLYGKRRTKRNTEKLIKELNNNAEGN
jgi:predicted site-specific integrase-resolvase